jgi:hypothetical protein
MRRQLVWALLLVVASFGFASAQETTSGSIGGTVVDAQGAPVPGATVSVTSGQGTKTFVTDNNGRFFAPFLTPGRYAVKVELTGFSAIEQKNIDVRLGQRLELAELTLKVGGLAEVVEVLGAAPTIDTSSTTVGGTLDSETLKRLPVGRNFTDTLYLVPGVSDSGGVGRANPAMSGASGLENNYIVDGVNITNAGYGAVGSYSIVFGSLGTGVTTDFIKETQVKTAGFEAEYGQSTGGVINIVTQSGTNSFHGSLFGYGRPGALDATWKQLTTPNGTVNTTERNEYDFGITLGGPVMKDKLFFFGAFNPQYQNRTFVAPAGFPLVSLGEVERKRRILAYAGKLTWQATSNHRFDASVFGDPAHGANGPQRPNTALIRSNTAGFSEINYGGHNQTIKYDGILSRSWLIEASFARAQNKITELPSVDEWAVNDTTVVPNRVSGGLGFYEQGNDGVNMQYTLKSTNIFNAGGNHQLRYGVQYEDIKYDNLNQRTGPTFTLPDGTQTGTGAQISVLPDPVFGRIFRVTRANLNSGVKTTQKYLSFFAQDTWQMGRFTLRPGVRYDQQDLRGNEEVPLCREGETVPGRADGTGAPKPCSFKWDGNFAPRLGATFDLKGDGRSKLFASWGRFYAKIPNDLAARAMSADAGVTRADYFDAGLTRPVPEGTVAAGVTRHFLPPAGLHAAQISLDSKSTYQQELLGGIEFAVGRNVNLGVRYIHRTLPRILEDYQPAPVVAFDLGCPGADSVEYFIDNISPNLQRFTCAGIADASFEDPEHTYDSVEVTANKVFADNWALVASYRWARLKGLFEGFYRNDNGQSDPSITSLFDFPTNDPSYTQIGVPQFGYSGDIRFQGCTLGCGILPNDRPHQFKLYSNYAFSNINLGVGFNAGSGRPLTTLAANPNYQNAGEIPLTLRGGGMQTVEGQLERSNSEITFDAHVDYTIRFGERRVMLIADAFNLFNRQEATDFDNWRDSGFGTLNPNFGQPTNGGGSRFASFQAPRSIRFGARFEW